MMWDRMGQEISAMITGLIGGHAYVSPAQNRVDYSGPTGGVGGVAGGVVRATTLRLVPIEDDPIASSLAGMEGRVARSRARPGGARRGRHYGDRTTHQPRLGGGAAGRRRDPVRPRGAGRDPRSAGGECDGGRRPQRQSGLPPGLADRAQHGRRRHRRGPGVVAPHLVVADATGIGSRTTSAGGQMPKIVTGGEAWVVPASGPDARYIVVTVPVTEAQAQAARAVATASGGTDITGRQVGQYRLLCTDCTTYAGQVMGAAGVPAPPMSTPALNAGAAWLASPASIPAMRAGSLGAAVAATGMRTTALEERLQMSLPSEHNHSGP
jgi:hypothetical protein